MAKVTAVAKVQKFQRGEESTQVNFYPAYDNPENKTWSQFTPSLSIQMLVKNEVADQFEQNEEYLITFEKKEAVDG